MMQNKVPLFIRLIIILVGIPVGIGLIAVVIGLGGALISGSGEGKAYASKERLCVDFAQSYLRTIPKLEPQFNEKTWQMAIDVETDLYNMCLLDLNKKALQDYKLSAIEKYKN